MTSDTPSLVPAIGWLGEEGRLAVVKVLWPDHPSEGDDEILKCLSFTVHNMSPSKSGPAANEACPIALVPCIPVGNGPPVPGDGKFPLQPVLFSLPYEIAETLWDNGVKSVPTLLPARLFPAIAKPLYS